VSAKKKKLTDEVLLNAITILGGKVTATELSQALGFPARTIRYRIKRLRDKGRLDRVWPQTLDTKLGLGEAGIVLDMSEEYRALPREFLFCFPNFFAHYASYGRYNGYSVSGGYPIGAPQIIDRIVRAMKQMNIIKDAYIFNTLDFISLSADLSKYSPNAGWNWDWREWKEHSEKLIKIGEPSNLGFDLNPGTMDYDHKDIAIIAEMKMDGGDLTHRELSKRVGLSETQVGVRIQRLKDANVLRGYLWLTEKQPQTIVLYTYLEIDDPYDPVLSCFLHLPFRREIIMDSPGKYCVRLMSDTADVVNYLKGLEALRPHFRSYFVQFAVSISIIPGGMRDFYHLHNGSTDRWEMPVEEYIQNLEKFLEKH
jgi:DNA-binding Lrp family transcriptional regulator